MALACCLYCRKEFETRYRNRRWHDCPKALEARKEWNNKLSGRRYRVHGPKHKRKLKNNTAHQIARNQGDRICMRCGNKTFNYFYCHECLRTITREKRIPNDALGYELGSGW